MGLPVNSVCQLSFRGLWQQQRILFTHTYKCTADASPDTPFVRSQAIAGYFEAAAAGLLFRYQACMANDLAIKAVRFQVVYPLRYQYGEVSSTKTGTHSAQADTGNIAAAVTLQTGVAGRGEIGNKHIGPCPNNTFLAGAPVTGYVTILDNLGSALSTDVLDVIGGSAIELRTGIFHRKTGQFSPVVIWKTTDRMGTLRRRTLRVGE